MHFTQSWQQPQEVSDNLHSNLRVKKSVINYTAGVTSTSVASALNGGVHTDAGPQLVRMWTLHPAWEAHAAPSNSVQVDFFQKLSFKLVGAHTVKVVLSSFLHSVISETSHTLPFSQLRTQDLKGYPETGKKKTSSQAVAMATLSAYF